MLHNKFMEEVENIVDKMPAEDLRGWILEQARTVSEDDREKFLDSFKPNSKMSEVCSAEAFDFEAFEEWCDSLELVDIYFECDGHEDYDSEYWNDDWVYEYSDPMHIGRQLEEYFRQAGQCVRNRQYSSAEEIYGRLLNLEFMASDVNGGDSIEVSLEEVVQEGLASIDLEEEQLNYAHAVYWSEKGKKRAQYLYDIAVAYSGKKEFLDGLLVNKMRPLEGFETFLKDWKVVLLNKEGSRAATLLTEACLYEGGSDALMEEASAYGKVHPQLYENACRLLLQDGRTQECEALARKAMQELPEQYLIRARIAKLGWDASKQLGKEEAASYWYCEVCYSDTCMANFLLLFGLEDWEKTVKVACEHIKGYHTAPTSVSDSDENEFKRNVPDEGTVLLIRFLAGDWRPAYEKCRWREDGAGRSGSFKDAMVALILIALNSSTVKGKGYTCIRNDMLENVYGRDLKGIDFESSIQVWKSKISFTEEECGQMIAWLEEEVDMCTEALVGGGHRHSYYKAARLIAALGELKESKGEAGAKLRLMEHYRKLHSRKTAFKAELDGVK